MKLPFSTALGLLFLCSSSIVTSRNVFRTDVSREDFDFNDLRQHAPVIESPKLHRLDKRKGGGGGGGGRGGGGGGGSGSGSGGSSGGRSGGGGRPGGAPAGTRPSSNAGGASRSGSGTPRNFGGGGFYAGGARVPYTAGRRSPGGLVPFFLPVALLGFFPGLWLFGAYAYSMNHGYSYRNRTTNRNESIPIVCLCQEHSVCGCDDNNNSTYIDSILSDKDENGLPRNSSVVKTVDVNGTTKIYINGTLPNGTTAPDPSIAEGMASGIMPPILKLSGYWPTIAIVLATVALL
ncbi:hypothetical protein LOZ12_004100 [Ophidiomyces ophidiicola]|uniref:Uncharacterized protein n=1 Tax=Ophidiomyces ophidiicola TaxID=1387563 RepID=A0ACB8V4A9_9EURO|nr:hypothetical protein LOZ64_006047 [Ophidiomyces ophidiicola]KAI1914821.1 hypothetical protein LOZ61_001958 [Ophidiomyces ophidiicola]KAI1925160.1 hypothetical protein LOZ60_004296 [Ophidiomyces ophidiicola]KAI1953446.1 hypothetical protein LOZ62_001003 [Ophidiomyces ophidiicola]KAI1957434.1 hypothetical protein LOZ59_003887 [Ophidiomyces ophidiicola]